MRKLLLTSAAALAAALCAHGAAVTAVPFQFQFQSQPNGLMLLLIREVDDSGLRRAIVADDFFYCYPPTRELIRVPASYVTDFASIPRWGRIAFSQFGAWAEASVVHDWMYAVGEPGRRDQADQMFRYHMAEQKVGWLSRQSMYRAVRRGGKKAYGRPGEFEDRFGDLETGRPAPPPFPKPASAIVDVLDSCDELETNPTAIRARHATPRSLRPAPTIAPSAPPR